MSGRIPLRSCVFRIYSTFVATHLSAPTTTPTSTGIGSLITPNALPGSGSRGGAGRELHQVPTSSEGGVVQPRFCDGIPGTSTGRLCRKGEGCYCCEAARNNKVTKSPVERGATRPPFRGEFILDKQINQRRWIGTGRQRSAARFIGMRHTCHDPTS